MRRTSIGLPTFSLSDTRVLALAYPAWLPADEDAINGILIVVSSEGLCSVSLLDYTGYTR